MTDFVDPKHILLVVWGLTHGKGGIERFGAALSRFLVNRGHRITVVAEQASGAAPAFALDERVELVRANLTDTRQSRQKLREKLVQLNPDVCVAFFSWSAMIEWPVLLHGTGIPLLLSERSNPRIIETQRWNRADRLTALNSADYIHLFLESYKTSLPLHLHDRVCVIPNGIPLPPLVQDSEEKPCNIMGMGRLIHSKQFHILINAFALVAEEFPACTLTIWGEGPERGRLEQLIASHGLQDRVILPGVTDDIAAAFADACVFCHPSAQEGFPTVVLEAFAAALPVIGMACCPGVNELIPPTAGILVPGENAQTQTTFLAEALHLLLRNSAERAALGQAARVHAQAFDQEIVFEYWEKWLRQCAASKGKTMCDKKNQEDPEAQLRRRLEALLSLDQIHSSYPRMPRLPLDVFPVPGCDPADYSCAPDEEPGPDLKLHTLPEMEACFIKVCIKLIEDSGLFDEAWYRKSYGRGRPEVMPPIEHYLRLGAAKGYEPNPDFKSAWYREHKMARHEDGLTPLVHFILYGEDAIRPQKTHKVD